MTRKIVSIFMLIVGGFAAAGWANGISKTGGWLWICGGLVIGLWKFVRGALAEGKVAEAEALLRWDERHPVAVPVEVEPEAVREQYVPVQFEVMRFSSAEPEEEEEAEEEQEEVFCEEAEDQDEPEEVDYDPFCRYADNLGKEKERLERVLWGLYNKRDKYLYMGVNPNTQRWRGLEWDIKEIERRLEALADVC